MNIAIDQFEILQCIHNDKSAVCSLKGNTNNVMFPVLSMHVGKKELKLTCKKAEFIWKKKGSKAELSFCYNY